jgi:hypothetical protein
VAFKKGETYLDIQNYKFVGFFLWVWNLVAHNEGEIHADGVREEGTEEDILP